MVRTIITHEMGTLLDNEERGKISMRNNFEAHKNQKKKYKRPLGENLLGTFLASAVYIS